MDLDMQLANLTTERKYLLIAAAILLLLGTLYRFGALPENFGNGAATIALREKSLGKYQASIRAGNGLGKRLMATGRLLERAETALLEGNTESLAAVNVQNALQKIAGQAGLELKSTRVMKAAKTDSPAYLAIPVNFAINGTMRQLKEIIYQIESAPTLLRITNLRISNGTGRESDQIQTTLTVEGYMKTNTPADREDDR